MGRAGLSGGCRPLRNPTLTTYYYARTSGGSPKRRHEPPMDAAGDGPVEDAGEDSRPGRAEVGGPRLQRGAQAEVRTMPLRRPQRHSVQQPRRARPKLSCIIYSLCIQTCLPMEGLG